MLLTGFCISFLFVFPGAVLVTLLFIVLFTMLLFTVLLFVVFVLTGFVLSCSSFSFKYAFHGFFESLSVGFQFLTSSSPLIFFALGFPSGPGLLDE